MKSKKELVLLREGKCLNCGKCCSLGYLAETTSFKKAQKSDKIEKFISEYGDDSKDIYCKHYDIENRLCKVFNQPDRPEACTQHPGSPSSVIEGCGYTFRFKRLTQSELNKLEWAKNVKIFRRKKS